MRHVIGARIETQLRGNLSFIVQPIEQTFPRSVGNGLTRPAVSSPFAQPTTAPRDAILLSYLALLIRHLSLSFRNNFVERRALDAEEER